MRKITVGSMFKIAFIFITIKEFYITSINIKQLFTNASVLKTFAFNVFIEFAAFIFLSLVLITISGIFSNRFIK